MSQNTDAKISVAISAANGNTICGFRSERASDDIEQELSRLAARIHRNGWDPTTSTVVTTDGLEPCARLEAAYRELERWSESSARARAS